MKTRKILSLFLALLLCAGLLPFPAMAQDAWDSMGFTCINITNAGAQDSMSYSWAEGRYPDLTGANNLSSGNLKYRTMVKAQILYEENRYYLPSSKADTTHELTLYGTESVEPETISISNVTVLSGFTRASYGSGKGTLYYYVAKISVPASGCQAVIKIGGKTLSTLALRRVIHYSGIPLVSTIWTKDYTEEAGRITEFVLRVSGFSIYSKDHPEWYTLRDYGNEDILTCTAVSELDDVGCFELTFSVAQRQGEQQEEDDSSEWWGELCYNNEYCSYFDEGLLRWVDEQVFDAQGKPVYDNNHNFVFTHKVFIDYDGNYQTYGTNAEKEVKFVHIEGENGNGETYTDSESSELYIDHPYYLYNCFAPVGVPMSYYCLYKTDVKGIGILVDEESCSRGAAAVTGTLENVGVNPVEGAKLLAAWYKEEYVYPEGSEYSETVFRLVDCAVVPVNINGATRFSIDVPATAANASEFRVFLLDGSTYAPLRDYVRGWYYADQ